MRGQIERTFIHATANALKGPGLSQFHIRPPVWNLLPGPGMITSNMRPIMYAMSCRNSGDTVNTWGRNC